MCDQIFLCLNKWQIFLCCYDWNACAELLLQCCMMLWIQTRSVICVSNPSPTTADSRAVCLYPCKNYRLWTILNLTTTNLIVTTSLVQSCSCCHKNNQSGWNQSVPALLVCHCCRLQCAPHGHLSSWSHWPEPALQCGNQISILHITVKILSFMFCENFRIGKKNTLATTLCCVE